MKVLLLTLAVVALCVLLLCFNILRRKEFPQFDVGGNEELRKRGIRCFKEEDASLHGAGCPGKPGQPEDCGQGYACDTCEFGARRAIESPFPEGRDLGRG
ncbi:MAG: hypothetical protein IJS62_03480 [Bacteroidales bacterium]|nr:hypothetical protein [Bacteroidales bacterium]